MLTVDSTGKPTPLLMPYFMPKFARRPIRDFFKSEGEHKGE
jgi:hypothetical protein